jgi:acetylornithine deacetylase/succinyl-diaminopimelate desuccinylase-like protein
MRLVADQRWRDVVEKFTAFMEQVAPSGTRVEVRSLHGGEPSRVDPATPALAAARRAMAHVFGTEPVMTREGGSIPVVTTFDAELGIPTVLMGFGLPDDRLHSPNEKFSLAQYERGIATSIVFLGELARG